MSKARVALFLLLLGAAPPEPQAKITGIEVRFFRSDKGEFTANQLDEKGQFFGWNTFLGDGNAGYGRGDAMVLVKVAMAKPDDCCLIRSPLNIAARNNGKLLAERRFQDIPTGGGEVARALFLQDIGCAGDILVRAKLGNQTEVVRLVMICGE